MKGHFFNHYINKFMEVKKSPKADLGRQEVYMVARWLRGSSSFHVRGVRMDPA